MMDGSTECEALIRLTTTLPLDVQRKLIFKARCLRLECQLAARPKPKLLEISWTAVHTSHGVFGRSPSVMLPDTYRSKVIG